MGNYSIKELEKLSGIKAHTIRIWEVRYGLLNPKRTDTNIRIYDDGQLKRLLNVALLIKKGFKISKISKLKIEELNTYLQNLDINTNSFLDDKLNGLVISMIELDEEMFEKIFSSSLLSLGFKNTLVKLIYPLLEKVGLFWSIGKINPAQEHFVSNLIRQKIITALDSQLPPDKSKSKFMLFLPEGEFHEIGLLTAHYLIKFNRNPVIYLGQNVPLQDAMSVYKTCHPANILVFVTTTQPPEEIQDYLNKINKHFSKSEIFISGRPEVFSDIKLPGKMKWLKNLDDLEGIL